MREQHDMEQLVEVEQMENNSRIEQQSQRIQDLEQHIQQMQESHNAGEAAVNIVNGLQAKGVISFNENGQVNVIGNAHEQPNESGGE